MAEISRAEALEKLCGLPIIRYGSTSDMYKALKKAISDMQKLEKIEKIVKE